MIRRSVSSSTTALSSVLIWNKFSGTGVEMAVVVNQTHSSVKALQSESILQTRNQVSVAAKASVPNPARPCAYMPVLWCTLYKYCNAPRRTPRLDNLLTVYCALLAITLPTQVNSNQAWRIKLSQRSARVARLGATETGFELED